MFSKESDHEEENRRRNKDERSRSDEERTRSDQAERKRRKKKKQQRRKKQSRRIFHLNGTWRCILSADRTRKRCQFLSDLAATIGQNDYRKEPKDEKINVSQHQVNLICCATNQGARIFKTPIPNGINLTNLKTMLVGGSKVPEELVRSLREKLPYVNVRQAYGMTEVGGLCTVQEPGDTNYDLATCGRVRQGFWYKVVDPETEEILGPNQQGELRLKTKLQMNGYYNLASSDAWDSNGWLKTGDIVHYDEDHYFFFVDRLKAVIKYRGIHVPSTLLEEILLGHPAVEEAAVIGLPHPEDEEHPMAAVVLKDGTGNGQEEEDLRRYVDDKVDDPKRLRGGVRIVQELPTTPTGKYNKREIKRRICEEMKIAL